MNLTRSVTVFCDGVDAATGLLARHVAHVLNRAMNPPAPEQETPSAHQPPPTQ